MIEPELIIIMAILTIIAIVPIGLCIVRLIKKDIENPFWDMSQEEIDTFMAGTADMGTEEKDQ